MKSLFIIIVLSILNISAIAQNKPKSSYNSQCDLWIITDGQSQTSAGLNPTFTWQYVSTPGDYQMLDIFFTDSLKGWVTHSGNGGFRTTDSGMNWTGFTFNDTNFSATYNGTYFIDQSIGWCVGGANQIRKTTDGGISWFKQYGAPVAGIARSVIFFNANTGCIAGSKNFPYVPFIEKTTNGGTNWIEITPVSPGQELNDQYWFNANTGWIAGYDVLLYTTNGGSSFTNLFSNIPPTGNGHSSLLSVYFINQQTGWLGAANLERNNIYKTTNGGANWVFQNNPVSQSGWNQINDIRFISQDTGWAVHGTPSTGAIMFTSNGGLTWVMDNTQNFWYDCIEIYSHSKIWCGSSSGRIWYANLNEFVGIEPISNTSPEEFKLFENYPNPFNPVTKIKFQIPLLRGVSEGRGVLTKIVVYDISGRTVTTLVNEQLKPGSYSVDWDASGYASGVYFYSLVTNEFTETKRMVLVK